MPNYLECRLSNCIWNEAVMIRIIDPTIQHVQSLISTSYLFATGVNSIYFAYPCLFISFE